MVDLDLSYIMENGIGAEGITSDQWKSFVMAHKGILSTLQKHQNDDGYAFLGLPEDEKTVKAIEAYARKVKGKFQDIVVLGIGGSALGTIALKEALLGSHWNFSHKPRLWVLDNIDPKETTDLFVSLSLKKTLFIVVSKSGTTVEPMALYALAEKMGAQHFAFITDPEKGLLREIASEKKIPTFEVPQKVGGRYSVLSAVSLLPAALVGIDIRKLLKGAREIRNTVYETAPLKNPAHILACAQYLLDTTKGKNITIMMPYQTGLFRVADWYRQLLAESLGKHPDVGPTPIAALGTTDQHSQLQLYIEGPKNKWVIFLKVDKHAENPSIGSKLPAELGFLNGKKLSQILEASYHGTSKSLAKAGRPNLTIHLDKVTPESLGGLFMLLEIQVALLGLLYNVNAFNQPGVEHSKVIAKKILSHA
jgi:glucose-6-phosphate isomerase